MRGKKSWVDYCFEEFYNRRMVKLERERREKKEEVYKISENVSHKIYCIIDQS